MVITEAELRQAWQNGRGQVPAFPPGTRFTPAALDFLRVWAPGESQMCGATQAAAPQVGIARRELKAPPGQRRIFTASDVPDLLAGGGLTLSVHPSVTITHAALEQLRKAGVRAIPCVETSSAPPETPPLPRAIPRAGKDEELFNQVKEAVLARLDRPVDPTVLEAVLRKVLAAL